jgi:hypothetical protein
MKSALAQLFAFAKTCAKAQPIILFVPGVPLATLAPPQATLSRRFAAPAPNHIINPAQVPTAPEAPPLYEKHAPDLPQFNRTRNFNASPFCE